jgi:EAL domain-containing protein (putative c-di-GMP-specific phosphodiesterase class I)
MARTTKRHRATLTPRAALRQCNRAIKIDRIFISGLDDNDEDTTLVQAIITMAHSLGLTVTAEGVERPEQLTILRALGCDNAQGFLLGRPTVPPTTTQANSTNSAARLR